MQQIIDPHLHFFDLSKGDYHWLRSNQAAFSSGKAKLDQNFSCQDLGLNKQFDLKGFVHIEAGFDNENPEKELAWLSSLDMECLAFKAIGFADVTIKPSEFRQRIKSLQKFPSLAGIRHIFDEQALDMVSNENTIINLQFLATQDLLFELQADFSNQDIARTVFDLFSKLPQLRLVINHAGLPCIEESMHSANMKIWDQHMQFFAGQKNTYIKCSGFEMLKRNFNQHEVAGVLNALVNSFGQSRVMMASNFPLVLLSMSYQEYWQMIVDIIKALNLDADALLCRNAASIYKLAIR